MKDEEKKRRRLDYYLVWSRTSDAAEDSWVVALAVVEESRLFNQEIGKGGSTMVAVTNRRFYTVEHKAEVLDFADENGVPEAARRFRHEPSLVYSWKANEKSIRKRAKKSEKQLPLESMTSQSISTLPAPPTVPRDIEPNEKGPKFTVRGLGPWLRSVVRRELPALVRVELERLMGTFESKIAELVREEIRRALGRAVEKEVASSVRESA